MRGSSNSTRPPWRRGRRPRRSGKARAGVGGGGGGGGGALQAGLPRGGATLLGQHAFITLQQKILCQIYSQACIHLHSGQVVEVTAPPPFTPSPPPLCNYATRLLAREHAANELDDTTKE